MRCQLVFPFKRRAQIREYVCKPSGLLAGPNEAHEYVVEYVTVLRHRLRQHPAAFHVFDQRRKYFAKARVLDGVSQVAYAFEQGNSRARYLLHVEAECNQIAARNLAGCTKSARTFRDLAKSNHVQSHAAKPQLEIYFVYRIQRAARGPAGFVDGLILK